jgi:mannosyltransferase
VLGGVLVGQRQSLWYDELYTAEVGTAGLPALARAVVTGTGTTSYLADVPPSYNAPYYVVVHLWLAVTRLPAGELGLRLLSLVAAVAAVAVLVRAVERLAGPGPAVAAGLAVATSPLLVEYSAEARMYGLAALGVAGAVLGLARWLDGAPRGLLLYGLASAGAGLAHWFTLPVLAGLAASAVLLRGRRSRPLVLVTGLAALPALSLVALVVLNGTGDSAVGLIRPAERPLPVLALQAWTGGSRALLAAVVAAALVAAVRAVREPARRPGVVVAACWLLVPLLLLWAADAVRPVFVPRYLLAALLGAGVLAALGTATGRGRAPLTAALVALSLAAGAPLLERGPQEDAKGAVAALAARHEPGTPVVAVDRRAALALEHYAPPSLRADVRVPPSDPPAGAAQVWLVRNANGARLASSDDDAVLRAAGLEVVETLLFPGSRTGVALQRWALPG